jgi:antitoxin component YwqK of YwqJK toxin-antitoxin module
LYSFATPVISRRKVCWEVGKLHQLLAMIKYILSTGTGVLLCGLIASAQRGNLETIPADPVSYYDPVAVSSSAFSVSIVPAEGTVASFAGNDVRSYSASVKRHKLHGDWKSWYSNQQLCDSGSFVKGIPDGEWKRWDIKGQLLSIRHYDASRLIKLKSEMRRPHPRMAVYPLTALYYKNRRQAEYYIASAYSFGFTTDRRIASLEAAVENNITPGNSYQPVFDECLHHGLYMNFYSDGRVKDSGYYKNGLRDRVWIHREITGTYLVGTYANGLKQGEWKQYNKNDKLQTVIVYDKRGKEKWKKRFR